MFGLVGCGLVLALGLGAAAGELVPLGANGAAVAGWHYAPDMKFDGADITTFPSAELDVLAAKAWCFADQRCAGFYYGPSEVHMKRVVPAEVQWFRDANAVQFGGVYVKPQCSTPMQPHPTQGDYTIHGTGFDAEAHYYCVSGLLIIGDKMRRCTPQTDPVTGVRTGYWSGTAPLCEPDPCSEDPPPFEFGSVRVVTLGNGERAAEYACDEGFALAGIASKNGVATRKCRDGRWISKFSDFANVQTANARCVRACGALPWNVANGKYVATSHVEGGRATLVCDELYVLKRGSAHWQCQQGDWAPVRQNGKPAQNTKAPVCRAVGCKVPRGSAVDRGLIMSKAPLQSNGRYAVGLTLSLRCGLGFRHFGLRSTTCQADGTWTTPFSAQCEPAALCADITCEIKRHRMVYRKYMRSGNCPDGAPWCSLPKFVPLVGSPAGDAREPFHHFEVRHSSTADKLVPDRHHHCAMEGRGAAQRCKCFCWNRPTGNSDQLAQQWGWSMGSTVSTQL